MSEQLEIEGIESSNCHNGCNSHDGRSGHDSCTGHDGRGMVQPMETREPAGAVLAIASEKGGVGKSTLAIHLAAHWHTQGLRVLVVDADSPQNTVLRWRSVAESAEVNAPPCVDAGEGLRATVGPLAEMHDVTIIDTPGSAGGRLRAALILADLVLVPTAPSTVDVWALEGLLNTIDEARGLRPDLRGALVVNKADTRTRVGRASAGALAGVEDLEHCPVSIGQRIAFSEAIAAGQGVTDYAASSEAAAEISQLAAWTAGQLEIAP